MQRAAAAEAEAGEAAEVAVAEEEVSEGGAGEVVDSEGEGGTKRDGALI